MKSNLKNSTNIEFHRAYITYQHSGITKYTIPIPIASKVSPLTTSRVYCECTTSSEVMVTVSMNEHKV